MSARSFNNINFDVEPKSVDSMPVQVSSAILGPSLQRMPLRKPQQLHIIIRLRYSIEPE